MQVKRDKCGFYIYSKLYAYFKTILAVASDMIFRYKQFTWMSKRKHLLLYFFYWKILSMHFYFNYTIHGENYFYLFYL